ncbi:hypothetical protein LTS16_019408 [Friedmanniomyces endolithicus]|nr:hypothetical protein LTR59_015114 [Friedmanniomyces endolithicus]KAK0857186.1 hypothetical protein LTS02_010322 [Friedmanniomyces endolithicus]KAK0880619.1 hypothetical protein LTR87_005583 [Friedmanniomyces endolithicus]KAK0905723.1 hypothetical protein LTR57_018144 [Friedmanniomyces endolithicus]KAK0995544.1 hypothetical protein LTS01_006736 [Friedmanniomyces endolithicus]
MQSVFKLERQSSVREECTYRRRRMHTKSRGACETCRRRRVKPATGDPTGSMHTMSLALLDTQLSTLLGRSPSATNVLPTDELRILQHFHAVTSRSMGSEATQKILHRNVLKRAWGHPYLMHMALAVATAHLRRLNVEDSVPRAGKQLSVVEAKHWQRALLLHREELSTANSEYDARYDARVETTFLTVVYSFALEDCLPLNAFSTESDDLLLHALSPLAACNGFRALRIIEGPRGSPSTWLPVLMATASGSEHGAFGSERPGTDGLPAALVDLCGLNAESTSDSDEYHRVLRLLAPVLKLKPSTDNFPKLFSVAGRSWLTIKPLLLRRDHRALLLVSYWFASLHQIDQWWLTARAKSSCAAIVAYLAQESDDDRIHRLLEYPATFGRSGLSRIWEAG